MFLYKKNRENRDRVYSFLYPSFLTIVTMKVAVIFNTFDGRRSMMFCHIEDVRENEREGIYNPRVLTKKQFFNHHYPKIKHLRGVKETAKSLY